MREAVKYKIFNCAKFFCKVTILFKKRGGKRKKKRMWLKLFIRNYLLMAKFSFSS